MSCQFRSDDTRKWPFAFGRGHAGARVVSASATESPVNEGISTASSGQKNITAGGTGFANGDLVLIHQSRGTGAGNWELNQVASGGGSTSLVMRWDLENTYTDSGASQAQMIKIPEYTTFTINSGQVLTIPDWDGNKGGIAAYLCSGLTTLTGSISLNGKGFRGGAGGVARSGANGDNGTQGEGTGGAGSANTTSANGNGGGGGNLGEGACGGNGGGNGAAGSTGEGASGAAGATAGAADLSTAVFGGAGGGGGGENNANSVQHSGGTGGDGGGFCLIITRRLIVSGGLTANGAAGSSPAGAHEEGSGGGAGGAGGSILFKVVSATLGSSLVTATAGAGANGSGSQNKNGGNGGTGRINIDHSGAVTGTTDPTFNDRLDPSIRSFSGGAAWLMLT